MTKTEEKLGKNRVKQASEIDKKGRHLILRSTAKNRDVYMQFNAASSDALPGSAQGHADALSVVLHIDKNPIIIDPGNNTYQVEFEWKKYFKGTLSHNTVKINLKDQAEIARPFVGLSHYKTKILETKSDKNTIRIKAQHDGYKSMGISHLREIIFEKSKNLIWINDTVECVKPGFYFVELPFHFHPKTFIKQNNPINFQASLENNNLLYLVTDKKLKAKMVKGQIIPQILGWYSDAIDRKEPCTTIYCTAYIERTETFQTIILIK